MAGLIEQLPQNIVYFVALGTLPSLIWLGYYLKKDKHPEPRGMILRVFFLGAAVTIPVIFVEQGASELFSLLSLSPVFFWLLYFILGVAFFEEIFKYLVARIAAFSSKEADEPVDIMLYMIVAALGFAAFENILLLSRLAPVSPLSDLVVVTSFRFVGATFLHALASGLFGYFLALSFYTRKKTYNLHFSIGLITATILHGLFNFYIYRIGEELSALEQQGLYTSEEINFFYFLYLLFPTIILIGLALFVSLGFKKLKRLKNVTEV